MNVKKAHCFFEQSGTFKNEFRKLGIQSEDYDIRNDFSETDHVVDLFCEIEKAYGGGESVFDSINADDLILAFFPCVRFESQILLAFRGDQFQQKKSSVENKLETDLRLMQELSYLYSLITKLVIVCIKKSMRLIIENPYSTQSFLITHWALKPSLIDKNRRVRGDYQEKPTAYWFVNAEPENNLVFEPINVVQKRVIEEIKGKNRTVERSMIHPQYAERFIKEFVLDKKYSDYYTEADTQIGLYLG